MNHSQYDIPTLVAASRLGDGTATEALLGRLEPLIVRLARMWGHSAPGLEMDDLAQEARLQVLEALQSWDEARSYTFAGWAARLIKHRYADLVQAAGARKRGHGYPSISLSQPMGWDAEAGQSLLLGDLVGSPGPEDEVLDRLDLERRLAPLTERQKAIARLLALGYGQIEIARALNLSIDAVRHAREKIAAVLLPEEEE